MTRVSENPYQTPLAPDPGFTPAGDIPGSPEDIRRKHLGHEASVKSIGLLYYLSGGCLMLIPIGILAECLTKRASTHDLLPAAVLLGMAAPQIAVAAGLRRFKSWSRVGGIILGAIGLLAFPVGTLIGGYIIYLLVCAKGSVIFSPEYKEIIAATPHLKRKTSVIIWVLLAIALLVLGGVGVLMVSGN